MFLKYFGGIEGGLMESNKAVTNQFIKKRALRYSLPEFLR